MFETRPTTHPTVPEREHGSAADRLRLMLNAAVLAPSGHNTQPWLFRLGREGVDLYADRRRALPVVDPDDRELTMSCGAALFHLRLAARHLGCDPVVSILPDPGDPDLLARLTLGAAVTPTPDDEALFAAIPERRTIRARFDDRAVAASFIRELTHAASVEGAHLHVVDLEQDRAALADLVAQGDRAQAADPRFRRELARWLHPNRSRSRDGIPGYAFGMGAVTSHVFPLLIRWFDWGKGQAARDRQLVERSPALAVLATERDGVEAWMKAGQALARVLLRATVAGVSASFLNQPVEVRGLRPKVRALLPPALTPQLVVRFGYGTAAKPTPRRAVEDVLL